ncbi:MAG: methyltransferase domain-containing protein [Acidimicrobiales bacterium]|jgi:SAM-dependent methyltransferase
MPWSDLVEKLACPVDHLPLVTCPGGVTCAGDHVFAVDELGYLEVAPPGSPAIAVESTDPAYAGHQESGGPRTYDAYLRPWLDSVGAASVLDVGCGVGAVVSAMLADGFDAVGLDIRGVTRFWAEAARDAGHFLVGDGACLPFGDSCFDAVLTLGVIEHIGTRTGHLSLAPAWREERARFAAELRRVTRPGGRILIACPNKWFPIDVQHGPTDQLKSAPLRERLFTKFGMNLHRTWGAYHLASYADLWAWFGKDRVTPLSLDGYFGFSALERPGVPKTLARVATAWVSRMPARARATPLNPYLLAEIAV